MSMSTSHSRAMANTRSICPRGSLSMYGTAPITRAPRRRPSTSSASVPGLFSSPSCGNTHSSTSIAQA